MDNKKRWLVLAAFGFSGAAALIYEVTWTRALALVLGSTTYALSTMLSTFMAGLAIGAVIGGRLADRQKNLLLVFGLLELAIGFFGLITIPLINSVPPLYFKLYQAFHLTPSLYFAFQFLLCAGIMLVPTTLMGATFPVVSRMVTESMERMGRGVGSAYSFNTLGAILGSFAAGFILIPLVGVRAATMIAAGLNVAVAVVVIATSKARGRGVVIGGLIVLMAAPLSVALVSKEVEWPVTYYMAQRFDRYIGNDKTDKIEILHKKDYREGRVKLFRDGLGYLIVQVGGRFEGTGAVDVPRTRLMAYAPIASHPGPRSFLLIGLGTGFTLEAAKKHLRDISVVEINDGVVEAMRTFGPKGLFEGVEVSVNDGRNYLMLSEKRFDIITSGPSFPTESGPGNLFTKEFYKLAETKLNQGGIFCQSLPYSILSNDDITMMLRTFGSVFEHVYMWKLPHSLDLLMVGSDEPFSFTKEEIMDRIEALNTTGEFLPYVLSKSPEEVREITVSRTDIPYNTDDRPILEFHAARNLLTGVRD